MIKRTFNNSRGFTLIEIVVSIGIFAIISGMMYQTFELIQREVSSTGYKNSLTDKGQRILSFIEEDIRMIGFLLGPDARIPYCTGSTTPPDTTNVIDYTSGNPFDSLQFLTSKPVTLTESSSCMTSQNDSEGNARIDYYLTSKGETAAGSTTLDVDAGFSCYGNDLTENTDPTENGRSLVTFDSLLLSAAAIAGSAPQVYYQIVSSGTTIGFSEALQQNIPDNSTVYQVRQYSYSVNGRNLIRTTWNKNCVTSSTDLINVSNAAGTNGGVDGLKFEFTSIDTITNTLVTSGTLPNLAQLKSITVWLLMRSDKADSSYNDTSTYTLGSSADKIVLGPFNDNYRRLILKKTVEVKNLASINQ